MSEILFSFVQIISLKFHGNFQISLKFAIYRSQSEDKALRRLVKNSFIVELADGHRKLRHLFLFNDVIVCAKYKPAVRDEFELKWFIPLKDICILEESSPDPKENSPVNILHLKSQACTVRDQIMLEEKEEKKSKPLGSRSNDKHRKKLHELEVQLVLASPNLVFRISNKSTGKTMNFFLSSDFERTQWIECIMLLQVRNRQYFFYLCEM